MALPAQKDQNNRRTGSVLPFPFLQRDIAPERDEVPFQTKRWEQGEHGVVIGDTGSGKTYLESHLLQLRQYVVVIRTKPDDIKFEGFHRVSKASQLHDQRFDKFLLVPKYEDQAYQSALASEIAWEDGGWCICYDELYYATQVLKLEPFINKLMTQGRSKHITVVAGMQRPAWISRFALSQATHAFIFHQEGRDIRTLEQSLSPKIGREVGKLRRFDFLYFYRKDRSMTVGNAKRLNQVIVR